MKNWIRNFTISLLFLACSPTRHYQKVATDTEVTPQKKTIIAPWVAMNFPPKERVKSDTVYETLIVQNQEALLELADIIDSLLLKNPDTIYQLLKEKCKTKVIQRTIRDTISQMDAATEHFLRSQLEMISNINIDLTTDNIQAEDKLKQAIKSNNLLKTGLILLGLFIAVLVGVIFKKW